MCAYIIFFSFSEVILIPKNRYKSRPLPHLVGGKDFFVVDSQGILPSSNDSEVGCKIIYLNIEIYILFFIWKICSSINIDFKYRITYFII